MIYFKKDERFYHVYLQSNFFGGTTVTCSWGVFDGNRGGYKYIFCHATILELNTESYRMNAAKLAKNHSNKTTKTRAKNMEKSDVK